MSPISKWYVVQTKPRQERVAQGNLERQGYPVYCPWITQSRRLRGSWQNVAEPLFPRYLFVQLTEGEDNFAPIRSTFGVSNMVRFGDQNASISNHVIEAIQAQEQRYKQDDPGKMPWKEGDRVQLLEGPFAGLTGVFQKKSNQARVIILLELLGRENRVKVDVNDIASAQ